MSAPTLLGGHRGPRPPALMQSHSASSILPPHAQSARDPAATMVSGPGAVPAPAPVAPLTAVDRKRRSSAAQNRSSSAAGFREGVGNLNRWSQSTGSSSTSSSSAVHQTPPATKSQGRRRNSFSKRLSFGGSSALGPSFAAGLGAHTTSTTNSTTTSPPRHARHLFTKHQSPPAHANASASRKRSGSKTQGGASTTDASPTLLPPILTLPSLSQAVTTADPSSTPATVTPSTAGLLTPANPTSTAPDYFGDLSKPYHSANTSPRHRPSPQQPATVIAPSPVSPLTTSPPRPQTGAASESKRPADRGHTRGTEADGKGSAGTDTNSSVSSSISKEKEPGKHRGERSKGPKHPSQKAMLSKALQKANTAVLLDNAQNFEGAIEAYKDACGLLHKVMVKSNAPEERKKLEAIRNTYTNRVGELSAAGVSEKDEKGEKALPARPASLDEYNAARDSVQSVLNQAQEEGATAIKTAARIVNEQALSVDPPRPRPQPSPTARIPPRRESLMPARDPTELPPALFGRHSPAKRPPPGPALSNGAPPVQLQPPPPLESDYMPRPLSPRRPSSPREVDRPLEKHLPAARPVDTQPIRRPVDNQTARPTDGDQQPKVRARAGSTESTSWLDTIDESGGSSGESSASSVHSRSSGTGLRRKRIRAASGATEADFDAALDAAVEAAYDDGYEPEQNPDHFTSEVVSNVRRNVEMAKRKAREAEREAELLLQRQRERDRLNPTGNLMRTRSDSVNLEYDDDEAAEEERMLEEMTRGFVLDDAVYDGQSKSALPRESDSSGFSGRTWGSSVGSSNPTTAATSLHTLAETPSMPSFAQQLQSKPQHPPPPPPPPAGSLPAPPLPPQPSSAPPAPPAPPKPPAKSPPKAPAQSVRNRRFSGQQLKQLKIETSPSKLPLNTAPAPLTQPVLGAQQSPKTAGPSLKQMNSNLELSASMSPPRKGPLQGLKGSSSFDELSSMGMGPALSKTLSPESDDSVGGTMTGSPEKAKMFGGGILKKNFSSTSLKNRNISVSSPEGSESGGPGTPLNGSFSGPSSSAGARRGPGASGGLQTPSVPMLPTPTLANFQMAALPTGGGMHLFDSEIHSPSTPGSPNPSALNAPVALEPCPVESILRPFWLMRCLYQTIVHPRGGYVSTKLFIPRDVWRVKGVKLKGVDEKMANCDFLTAALQNLAKVDPYDADALLDEMQALENVLDTVQAALQKKLGSEVGLQGSMAMFKDAEEGDGQGTTTPASSNTTSQSSAAPKNTSTGSGKSGGYLSWKRLRSKNSGAGLGNAFTAPGSGTGSVSGSVPMTSGPPSRRHPPGSNTSSQHPPGTFSGPNAAYMNALARLFDAAQVIDQVARQVEDPGLKHSSPTQVGLELSTRHAAEFFAFYICRFVLQDVGTMVDKFIKRGSEWVLA